MPRARKTDSAVIVKHDFLVALDRHTRDYGNLCELRELFEGNPKTADILQYFKREKLIDKDLLELIQKFWVPDRGKAWPDVVAKAQRGFLDAFVHCRPSGPYLSSWIVIGASEDFEVEAVPTRSGVFLHIMVPQLPSPKKSRSKTKHKPKPGGGEGGPMGKAVRDPRFMKHVKASKAILESFET